VSQFIHLLSAKSHPTEIATERRAENAAIGLDPDALADQRRNRAQVGREQVIDPGQQAGGLAGKELDNGLGDIGQTSAGLLCAQMRGNAPKCFLAREPDTVGDFVDEAAFRFDAFGDDQPLQFVPPPVARSLIMGTIAVALELKE
jgi:hypothetical protein